jgi:hypothetical protein
MYWTVVMVRWQVGDGHVLNCCYSEVIFLEGTCAELLLEWGESFLKGMYWIDVILRWEDGEEQVRNTCNIEVIGWQGHGLNICSVSFQIVELHLLNCCFCDWTGCRGSCIELFFWRDRLGGLVLNSYGDLRGFGEHVLNGRYSDVTGWGGACTKLLVWWRDCLGRGIYWTVVMVRWNVAKGHVPNTCYGDVTCWGGKCTGLVLW